MAVDENAELPPSPQDARLSSLDIRLKLAERTEGQRRPTFDQQAAVRSSGMRALQSLVGMPLGGALIGWFIDRFTGTAPWIMLALMFMGFAGSVIDMVRISKSGSGSGAES